MNNSLKVCFQKVKMVKMMVKKCQIKCVLLAWIYFLKFRSGVKVSRFSFIVLYFWESFADFLIFISSSLRQEKSFKKIWFRGMI